MDTLAVTRMSLVTPYSVKHKLDPILICALIEHESTWNQWAVRFEPAFYERYTKPMTLSDTEEYTAAMSFGYMQIMGETAREFGFTGKYLTALCDPANNLEYGCRKLARCFLLEQGALRESLLRYNGGASKNYPDLVIPLMSHYS